MPRWASPPGRRGLARAFLARERLSAAKAAPTRRLLPVVIAMLLGSVSVHAQPPAGRFSEVQCIACHGEASAEVHGWRLSKHGVLARIGAPGRAPGCVDCHTAEAHRPADPEKMKLTCGRCHSPRYVETLRANGARMVEVGNMKQREALALLTQARTRFPAAELGAMEGHYRHLLEHLRNLRLGVAHQSPDHQWWHGHPALDGDLLRLKGAYDDLVRREPPANRR